VVFALATALAVIGALGVLAIEPWLEHYLVTPLYLACLTLPFYTLTSMLDGIARSYNWVNLALVPPYIGRPLAMIAVMGVAYAAGLPAHATTPMIAAAVAPRLNPVSQLLMLAPSLHQKVD